MLANEFPQAVYRFHHIMSNVLVFTEKTTMEKANEPLPDQKIQEHKDLLKPAARWFHQKWNIPESAYLESMEECLNNTSPVPQ